MREDIQRLIQSLTAQEQQKQKPAEPMKVADPEQPAPTPAPKKVRAKRKQ